MSTAVGLLQGSSNEPRIAIPEDQYLEGGVGWGVAPLSSHRRGIVFAPSVSNVPLNISERTDHARRLFPGEPTEGHYHAPVPVSQMLDTFGHELGREAALRGGVDRLSGSYFLRWNGAGWTRHLIDGATLWKAACAGSTGCTIDYAKTFMEPLIARQRALTDESAPTFRGIDLREWEGRGGGAWQSYQEDPWSEGDGAFPFAAWKQHARAAQARESWNARRALELVEHAAQLVRWQAWKQEVEQQANLDHLQQAASSAVQTAWLSSGGELGLDLDNPDVLTLLVDALTEQFGGALQPASVSNAIGASSGQVQSSEASAEVRIDNTGKLLIAAAASLVLLIAIR